MRCTSRFLPSCLLAASAVLLLLGSCAVKADTYSAANFSSPAYTDSIGTYTFVQNGVSNTTFTLNPVGSTTVFIDFSSGSNFDPSIKNAAPPQIFTGTASSLFTLNGVSQTLSDNYTLDGTTSGPKSPRFLGGPSVLFNLGVQGNYIVTPIIGNIFRQATITAAPAVPEPGSVALLVGMGTMGAAFLRRRKQANKAA